MEAMPNFNTLIAQCTAGGDKKVGVRPALADHEM
jgi:hypothetical protein